MMHQFNQKDGEYVDINIGVKLHNRFDIEVKDITTGEIVKRAQAENIVLNTLWDITSHLLCGQNALYPYWNQSIFYGAGSGTLAATRTALFSQIGVKASTTVELVQNAPPTASFIKKKIIIGTTEHVGATFTEVGIGCTEGTSKLYTHALLEDAEGNPISIGPKTDTQEITIYATVFAEITLADGMKILFSPVEQNSFIRTFLGSDFLHKLNRWSLFYKYGQKLRLSSNKSVTDPAVNYSNLNILGYKEDQGIGNRVSSSEYKSDRIRFEGSEGNGKVWSMIYDTDYYYSASRYGSGVRILFPNTAWTGYNFIGKAIGTGDGSAVTFNIPWSDINTSKTYKIYVDGIEKTEGVDYTLSNSESSTTVTFTTAPANGLPITGDWWVDYIPKDADHILDITFTATMGSV